MDLKQESELAEFIKKHVTVSTRIEWYCSNDYRIITELCYDNVPFSKTFLKMKGI